MSFGKNKMGPLKAIMVLMIIAGHMALFYNVSWLRPFIEVGAPIVSVFFFISGYGLHKSYSAKGDIYLKLFFAKRFLVVLIPYILATLLYCVLFWPEMKSSNFSFNGLFLKGTPILPYSWFVIEILVFYLFFYFSYKFFNGKWKYFVLCLLIILFMASVVIVGYDRAWWVSSLAFPAGVLFALHEIKFFSAFTKYPASYWYVLGILLFVFLLSYLTGQQYIWTVCYVCIPLFVALVVARLPVEKLNVKAIEFLAFISYEMYLCQGISMQILRGKLLVQNDVMFVVLVYALTIAMASGVLYMSRWITHSIRTFAIT